MASGKELNLGHHFGEIQKGHLGMKTPARFLLVRCIALAVFAGLVAAWHCRASDEPAFASFSMAETPLTLRAEATSRRFIAAHGRRGMVVGYAAESLEGWIYPFRIFHDFRVGFRADGSSEVVPGSALVRQVLVNPESVTRVYSGENFTVRETLFVPLDVAGFVILYEVESRAPLHITLSFQPDLDLMWPGGIGGQSWDWEGNLHAYLLQESSQKYTALVGSPAAAGHSPPASYSKPWDADRKLSLELDVIPTTRKPVTVPLIVSLGLPEHYDARKIYAQLLEQAPQLVDEARNHYRKLVESNLQIETPDRDTNLAYAWARIALEQSYVCNPFLGCGLVAGYGPSRDTRRPQYAWFFGGDALNNTFALEAGGDHDLAREAVRFVQKYQKKDNGEIFHELSQSAGLIDWFKDFPYAYRHTDASAMYLAAFGNLYRASGDQDFLRASWDSLRAAYRYLLSRLDPSDGLVTVPPGGWGGDETIGEQVSKDIYLESLWVAGAESLAELATVMGDGQLSSDARARAEKARASIAIKLWNSERNFFFYGFNARGDLLKQELGQPNWGIWLGAFDPEKSALALDRMARASFEADWGLRSIPEDDALYSPASYGHGSVWPLGTGVQALAFYRHHRPLAAYPLARSLVDQSFVNSLGHVPEVFTGEFYRELDVSVPEQIWSSGMLITSLLRGLLGLEPDAPGKKLVFAPHLPASWPNVKLQNLRIGQSTLNLEMEQSESQVRLSVENAGAPVEIEFSPEIPLGAKNLHASVGGRRVAVTPTEHAQDIHAEIKFRVEQSAELILRFDPGVRPWVAAAPLAIGDTSRGLRVLSSQLEGRTYRAEVEGRPGACSPFTLRTPWRVRRVTGGEVSSHEGSQWNFIVTPTQKACGTPGAYQTWTFQVEFAP